MQIYDELIARGLLAQVTDEDEIRDLVNNGKATFYIGFDCTADSLTAGHFMAQIGSFVPADEANIGICDRIFKIGRAHV